MATENLTLLPTKYSLKTKRKYIGIPSTAGRMKYVFAVLTVAIVALVSLRSSCTKDGCFKQKTSLKVSTEILSSEQTIQRNLTHYRPPSTFPIFVISPTAALFRRQHVASQLLQQEIDFEWFDTTDNAAIKDMNDTMSKFCGYSGDSDTVSWEASECTTHLRLMHRMLADNVDIQLVLTDDILFSPQQGSFLDTLQSRLHELPSDWELLWLHTNVNTSAWLDQSGRPLMFDEEQTKGEQQENTQQQEQQQPQQIFAVAPTYSAYQTPKLYEMKRGDTSLRAMVYTRDFAEKVLATVYSSSPETSILSYFSSFITEVASSTNPQFTVSYAAIPNLVDVQPVFPLSLQQKEQALAMKAAEELEIDDDDEQGVEVEQGEDRLSPSTNISNIKNKSSKNNNKKKHIVFAATGDVSQLPNWMDGYEEEANWDIVAIYYGDNPYYDCPQCIAVQRLGGAKYNLIYQFMQTPLWKELHPQYSSMMITDDDLIMDVHSLNIAFDIFTKYNLTMAQQSVCKAENSWCVWDDLLQKSENLLRYTNWVEIMAPIFKADFFNKEVNYTMSGAWTGLGLDTVWPALLGYPKDKIGVIDAVCMAHPKEPLLTMQGRKRIYSDKVLPFNEWEEERQTLSRFSLNRDLVGNIQEYSTINMNKFLFELSFKERMYYLTHRQPSTIDQLNQIGPHEDEPDHDPPRNKWSKAGKVVGVGLGVVGAMALVAGAALLVMAPSHSMTRSRSYQMLRSLSSSNLRGAASKTAGATIPRVASGIKAMWTGSGKGGNGSINSNSNARRSASASEIDLRLLNGMNGIGGNTSGGTNSNSNNSSRRGSDSSSTSGDSSPVGGRLPGAGWK